MIWLFYGKPSFVVSKKKTDIPSEEYWRQWLAKVRKKIAAVTTGGTATTVWIYYELVLYHPNGHWKMYSIYITNIIWQICVFCTRSYIRICIRIDQLYLIQFISKCLFIYCCCSCCCCVCVAVCINGKISCTDGYSIDAI